MIIHTSCFFFFKQKTAYEMRISDWSSDVCSSDLQRVEHHRVAIENPGVDGIVIAQHLADPLDAITHTAHPGDRKSVVYGKSVSVRVDLGGRRLIKKTLILHSAVNIIIYTLFYFITSISYSSYSLTSIYHIN